jgi:DNA-binding NarL/FixJ family response regulator
MAMRRGSKLQAKNTISVLVVDDHEVVRMGLRTLLEHHEAFSVVGEAGDAKEAVRKALFLRPDVVLMDVRLPDESGVEACRRIRSADPQIHVLMLTSYSDEEAIFASIMAGASGYLLKRIEADQLCQAVSAVSRGETLLDPAFSRAVMERIIESNAGAHKGMDALSGREKEILELIAHGLTNRQIADKVCLSEKTVRNYVTSIFHKLDVSHRTQAAVYYLERKPTREE